MKVSYTINALSSDVTDQLMEIKRGDMPTVVIYATDYLKAINNFFKYGS